MSHFRLAGFTVGTVVGVALLSTALSAAAPDVATFETVLAHAPITDATKDSITGQGAATAKLEGNKLAVSGVFAGLTTPATDAHLMTGIGIGIPGTPLLDLTITAAKNGTISGSFTLNRAQLGALKSGRIYIQIDSQKAPAPSGNLWGWLLPEHEKAGQDEPQVGHWYLPQGDGLKAHGSSRQS
jgi:hypothetical protein